MVLEFYWALPLGSGVSVQVKFRTKSRISPLCFSFFVFLLKFYFLAVAHFLALLFVFCFLFFASFSIFSFGSLKLDSKKFKGIQLLILDKLRTRFMVSFLVYVTSFSSLAYLYFFFWFLLSSFVWRWFTLIHQLFIQSTDLDSYHASPRAFCHEFFGGNSSIFLNLSFNKFFLSIFSLCFSFGFCPGVLLPGSPLTPGF